MTYHQHTAGLARSLAALVAAGQPGPPPTELPAVEAYRTDVLDGLDGIHRTLFPGGRKPLATVAAGDVEREPLSALGALLAAHPRSPASTLAPTDRAQVRPQSRVGGQWKAAATHAILAVADATHLQLSSDSDPAASWQALADLADATHAFAIADHDLTVGARQHTEPTRHDPAGLRLAAEHCARVARSGPLQRIDDPDTTARPPARPMAVTSAADLEPAQRRLAVIMADSDPPATALLRHVATGQARAHLSAAQLLHAAAKDDATHAADYHGAADALHTRARDLTDIASSCRAVESLAGRGDLRAVQQTSEIMRELQRMERDPAGELAPHTPRHLLAWARRGSDVVAAIDNAVARGLQTGQYLAANPLDRRDLGDTRWVPARLLADPPPLLSATSRAAERDLANRRTIAQAVTAVGGLTRLRTADMATQAFGELRRALAERTLTRPPRPGDPAPGFSPTRPAGAPRR